jgi:excisionase family DNA binding protein
MTGTLLTVKQAAERLGVSAATVYQLCSARRIRHERYGVGRGTIKIPEDALDEYRRSVTVEPAIATLRPRGAQRFKHLS